MINRMSNRQNNKDKSVKKSHKNSFLAQLCRIFLLEKMKFLIVILLIGIGVVVGNANVLYHDEDTMSYQNFPFESDSINYINNVNEKVEGERSPIILIPGLEASQVEAKLTNKKETRHFFCSKNSDWFLIWLNPEEFIPKVIDCFSDNFKLFYNRSLRRTENAQGVDIRIPGFGETHSIEYLSNLEIGPLTYFHNMVEKLVAKGFVRGKTVRGAPYDFRRSPNENEEFFINLTSLIEETYAMNGNVKNTIICHSMGCLYSLYFLNKSPQEWKDKYVKELITISAPFGGAGQSVRALTAGTNFHLFIYKDRDFREMERTFSSLSFLLPVREIWKNIPILSIEGTNYTASQLGEVYDMLHDDDGKEMWLDNKGLVAKHEHPGVPVVCIHGAKMPTPERINYKTKQDFPDKYELINGNGDGTVNDVSAAICEDWAKSNSAHRFIGKIIPNIGHLDMVKHDDVVDYVLEMIN